MTETEWFVTEWFVLIITGAFTIIGGAVSGLFVWVWKTDRDMVKLRALVEEEHKSIDAIKDNVDAIGSRQLKIGTSLTRMEANVDWLCGRYRDEGSHHNRHVTDDSQ